MRSTAYRGNYVYPHKKDIKKDDVCPMYVMTFKKDSLCDLSLCLICRDEEPVLAKNRIRGSVHQTKGEKSLK